MSWCTEFATGLRRTLTYLLSHHEPHNWDHCYCITVPGLATPLRICARCTGIYPGILHGVFAAAYGVLPVALPLVVGLPLFAVVEWSLTAFTSRRGSNPIRTITGGLLGLGYGLGLVGVLRPETRTPVLLAGACYLVIALGLLARYHGGGQTTHA